MYVNSFTYNSLNLFTKNVAPKLYAREFITAVILILTTSVCSLTATAQVGINVDTPHTSAALQLQSTNQGLLLPRMTSLQRNAIASPTNSLIVFDTDLQTFFTYNTTFSQWERLNRKTDKFEMSLTDSGNVLVDLPWLKVYSDTLTTITIENPSSSGALITFFTEILGALEPCEPSCPPFNAGGVLMPGNARTIGYYNLHFDAQMGFNLLVMGNDGRVYSFKGILFKDTLEGPKFLLTGIATYDK